MTTRFTNKKKIVNGHSHKEKLSSLSLKSIPKWAHILLGYQKTYEVKLNQLVKKIQISEENYQI